MPRNPLLPVFSGLVVSADSLLRSGSMPDGRAAGLFDCLAVN